MQLSAYSMMAYESTRKSKMFQINMRTVRPDDSGYSHKSITPFEEKEPPDPD